MRRHHSTFPLLATLGALLLAACASGPTISPAEPPAPAPGTPELRGVPGFDTREYPGDSVMKAWREASPYSWMGYYLESPCRPRSTWTGKRAALAAQGWGFAVLYVGEQQWADTTSHAPSASGQPLRCTRANLTAEKGTTDAHDAQRVAQAEGFPPGTRIFLNVERVDSVGVGLAAYVQAWLRTLLAGDVYLPALYAHAQNAAALQALAAPEFAGRSEAAPSLWIAKSGNFNIAAAPAESGVTGARIWQGRFNVDENWGGAAIRIDVNVADRANPSAP